MQAEDGQSMTAIPGPRELFESTFDAVESIFNQPWSDGLPVVPPTPDRVEEMIEAGGREGDNALGTIKARDLTLYVWQAATCAVMAGCLPSYFPVVLATWDAMFQPAFNINTVLSSTGGASIAALVSGPYAEKIGMRSGLGLFSPGNRANATIGRAIRLGALTALKAIVGELDASSFGHAGKYTFHFAESTPPYGWATLRERLGYSLSDTTVSILSSEAPRQVAHRFNPTAQGLLNLIGSTMKMAGGCCTGSISPYFVLLGPEHAGVLFEGGLGLDEIQYELSRTSAISPDELRAAGIEPETPGTHFSEERDERGYHYSAKPENILVTTAGGQGAGWSMVVPSWSMCTISDSVTWPVQLPL